MYIIPKFLYNDLTYDIYTGIEQTIVDNTIIPVKINAPKVTWKFKFDYIKEETKNYIEQILLERIDDTYINPGVGPSYKIFRYIDINNTYFYYYTYAHEYAFYSKIINRVINYTESGNDHILDGGLVVPKTQTIPIEIKEPFHYPRKVLLAEKSLSIVHKANGLYNLKLNFEDLASTINLPDNRVTLIGYSYASDTGLC